jgi:hypothetical protein
VALSRSRGLPASGAGVWPRGRARIVRVVLAFTEPAVQECENALSQPIIVLAEVNEIFMLLEGTDAILSHWLRAKIMAASVARKPLFYPALRTRSA